MKPEPEMLTVPRALHLARAFLDDHFADPLEIAHIAARAHFSRYHFIRLFRRVFHETPHQYLTRKRIEKAKELLANSDLSVTEICFAVGFESLGSFSALFRRAVGWAPSVYRARVLEQRQTPQKFIPHCFVVMYGLRPVAKVSNFQEAKIQEL
jgi:AraC-like DNA-binding protein